MDKIQILIAGIPASGKSTFGKWLAKTHGFIHVDMELPDTGPGGLKALGLGSEWKAFLLETDSDSFLKSLREYSTSVALDWGFPPNPWMLSVVSRLDAGGVRLWWFDGDRLAARALFESRGNKPVDTFDNQVAGISAAWAQISALAGHRIVKTVSPDGSFPENAQIYSMIVGHT